MENLSEALGLLVVGMTTVFVILLIVIYLGKALIALVNKYAPAEEHGKKTAALASALQSVDATTKSVIAAAVSQLTGSKGKVNKIEKI